MSAQRAPASATAPALYGADGRVVRTRGELARGGVRALYGSGGYVGARSDRRALKEWWPGAGSADSDTLPDLPTLRGRVRDLVRNAPIAAGAINTKVSSTVGTGLRPQARIDRELLGLTEEQAAQWERQAERLWWMWAGSPACDLTGHDDFAGLTELVDRSTLESGDVFVLRRHRPQKGDLFGLKLQVVEADRVSNPHRLPDTASLAGGVELDRDGRPVRYHVQSGHPGDLRFGFRGADERWDPLPAFGPVSGERMVLHVFHRLRSGQRRGVPELAPVIEPLKQLTRYTDAELTAAVISAFFTVFVKTPQVVESELAPPAGVPGALEEPEPVHASAADLRLDSGAILELAPGEDIEVADPKRPNDKFDPFFLAMVRQIGTAIEIPFEVLIKHFSSSYSASRAAMLEFWRAVLTRRARLVRQFCQPVWVWFITEAISRGYLAAPGFFTDPQVRAAYLRAEWAGPAVTQVDPVKEVTAAEKRVALGVSTLQEETAQLTGGDWEQKHAQRAKEVRMRREAGLDVEPVAERVRTEPVEPEGTEPTDDPDEDEEKDENEEEET